MFLQNKLIQNERNLDDFVAKTWNKLENILKSVYIERKEANKRQLELELVHQESTSLLTILHNHAVKSEVKPVFVTQKTK